MNISCAILAGGNSSRMGTDKATILLKGRMLISYSYEQVKEVFQNIFVVSSVHKNIKGLDIPIIPDIVTIKSPLTGIVSALLHSVTSYTFILACDMPFVSKAALYSIIEKVDGSDIIIAKTTNGLEPLFGLYNKSCIPYFVNAIKQNNFKIQSLFPLLKVQELENHHSFLCGDTSVFTNVNTKQELLKFNYHHTHLHVNNS